MKQYLKPLSYVLLVHVVALVIMSLFRLVFYLTVAHQLTPDVSGQPHLIATAFLRGVWFDNVIACYITALPLVVVCVMAGVGCRSIGYTEPLMCGMACSMPLCSWQRQAIFPTSTTLPKCSMPPSGIGQNMVAPP